MYRPILRVVLPIVSLILLFHVPGLALAEEPQSGSNKELVQRLWEEVLVPGALDKLSEFVVPDLVAGFEKRESLVRGLFPNVEYKIEEILAEGDRVVVFYRVTGRHTGSHGGLPASQGRLDGREMDLFRVQDGKIHDVQHLSDRLAVALATGYTLVPPG